METSEQRVVITALIDAMKANNSWRGETHVQKCAYFLQEGLGVPLGLAFVLYKHGPFSFDLRQLLGEMRADLLIEVRSLLYAYGPSLELSASGQALRTAHLSFLEKWGGGPISYVAKNLGPRDVAGLERLGTALYVIREDSSRSVEDLSRRIVNLKPHIPVDLARSAVKEVRDMLGQATAV